jgi:hypothetical protein
MFFLGCQFQSQPRPVGLEVLIFSGMYFVAGVLLGCKLTRIKETTSNLFIRTNKLKKEEI